MELINKRKNNDLPPVKPWEDRPISQARWRKHARTMLARCAPGQRPVEWWIYEKGMPRPQQQEAYLYENMRDELSKAELAQLMPIWREQWHKAQQPGFSYCTGQEPGKPCARWIEGDAAREAFFDWTGMPRMLIHQWDAEAAAQMDR